MTSLMGSCGARIWSLEIGVQSCPFNNDASLASLIGFMQAYLSLFSQWCCVLSRSEPWAHGERPLPLSPWPGQAVPCSQSGLVGVTVALWLFLVDQVVLLIWSGLWASGAGESRRFSTLTFLKAWLCFLWHFFHWLCDLHGICSIPSVLLMIIIRASVILYYDNTRL